jgi:predicted small lipoprotein YifL
MTEPSRMLRRLTAAFLIALMAGGALAACGKKGDPKPPSGDEAPYPLTYPEGAPG